MSLILLFLSLAILTALLIWGLHRSQRNSSLDMAERSGPLPGLEKEQLSIFAANDETETEDAPRKNWLNELRVLREQQQYKAAFTLAEQHFPKVQAFQQAAIITRQEIRDAVEAGMPANAALGKLYRTAVLANLFRTDNLIQPADPEAALVELQRCEFPYADIGYHELKLLNKSDIRHLQQLWGSPEQHRHAEEALGELWASACMAGAG